MFGLFKKKTEEQKRNEKYKELMAKAHQYSATDRKLSDSYVAEANKLFDKRDN